MIDLEKEAIIKAREYQVVKSNELVLKTRYQFSITEQKTIAYVCSMIKPSVSDESGYMLDYEFNILEYAKICGIESTGKLYDDVKRVLKGLRDKSMWLTLPNGSETVVGWLDRVTTDKGSGIVKIKIDDRLVPYLFDLKSRYLSYGLKNILCIKSQYSIRIYELLKTYYEMKIAQTDKRPKGQKITKPNSIEWTIDINELKKMLMVDTIKSYNNYKDFRKKVLEPAYREINELTDIFFKFEPIPKGRKVIGIKFIIIRKDTIQQFETDIRTSELLGLPEDKEKAK